jgi:hypothetical protein
MKYALGAYGAKSGSTVCFAICEQIFSERRAVVDKSLIYTARCKRFAMDFFWFPLRARKFLARRKCSVWGCVARWMRCQHQAFEFVL